MNFELWLFAIKHLGTTMEVTKTIFDSMSPDRQKEFREEYEKEYGGKSNVPKVRITVLKTECYDDIQNEYADVDSKGPCKRFKPGDKYTIDGDNYYTCAGGKFCSEAWCAISKYIYAALNSKDKYVKIKCCNSGTKPVIFKIEHID